MSKDNLFYSEEENILFWVAGYTAADNTQHVDEIITSLRKRWNEFVFDVAKLPPSRTQEVKTDYITESRRYKYMRVFWCGDVEPEDVPEDAFHITGANGWTMWKWLRD